MALLKIDTAFNIDLEFEIAEFHKRLLSYMIDFVLLLIYLMLMKFILHGNMDSNMEFITGVDPQKSNRPLSHIYSYDALFPVNGVMDEWANNWKKDPSNKGDQPGWG